MANANLEVIVKIDPSSREVIKLVLVANRLLYVWKDAISEFEKFSPALCDELRNLEMAVKDAKQKMQGS